MAQEKWSIGHTLTVGAGAFGLISALTGFYVLVHELCQDSLPFLNPLGDITSLEARL